jgi:tetrahydromethanopterin S-methyltransferase subunit B
MANRLTSLEIDEVSCVTRAANGKRFLILKAFSAEAAPKRAEGKPGAFGWIKEALKKAAGAPGPEDGGPEMTVDEIKKAVTEALEEGLQPINERIAKLEATQELATDEPAEGIAKGEGDGEPTADEGADVVKAAVADALGEALKPLAARIDKLESAAGQRQSGAADDAHSLQKSSRVSWSGIL